MNPYTSTHLRCQVSSRCLANGYQLSGDVARKAHPRIDRAGFAGGTPALAVPCLGAFGEALIMQKLRENGVLATRRNS